MATGKSKSITKADIEDFRKLIEMHREYNKIVGRIAKKLNCEFHDLSDWSEQLGASPSTTDEDIAFAMGRLSIHEF